MKTQSVTYRSIILFTICFCNLFINCVSRSIPKQNINPNTPSNIHLPPPGDDSDTPPPTGKPDDEKSKNPSETQETSPNSKKNPPEPISEDNHQNISHESLTPLGVSTDSNNIHASPIIESNNKPMRESNLQFRSVHNLDSPSNNDPLIENYTDSIYTKSDSTNGSYKFEDIETIRSSGAYYGKSARIQENSLFERKCVVLEDIPNLSNETSTNNDIEDDFVMVDNPNPIPSECSEKDQDSNSTESMEIVAVPNNNPTPPLEDNFEIIDTNTSEDDNIIHHNHSNSKNSFNQPPIDNTKEKVLSIDNAPIIQINNSEIPNNSSLKNDEIIHHKHSNSENSFNQSPIDNTKEKVLSIDNAPITQINNSKIPNNNSLKNDEIIHHNHSNSENSINQKPTESPVVEISSDTDLSPIIDNINLVGRNVFLDQNQNKNQNNDEKEEDKQEEKQDMEIDQTKNKNTAGALSNNKLAPIDENYIKAPEIEIENTIESEESEEEKENTNSITIYDSDYVDDNFRQTYLQELHNSCLHLNSNTICISNNKVSNNIPYNLDLPQGVGWNLWVTDRLPSQIEPPWCTDSDDSTSSHRIYPSSIILPTEEPQSPQNANSDINDPNDNTGNIIFQDFLHLHSQSNNSITDNPTDNDIEENDNAIKKLDSKKIDVNTISNSENRDTNTSNDKPIENESNNNNNNTNNNNNNSSSTSGNDGQNRSNRNRQNWAFRRQNVSNKNPYRLISKL